MTTTIRAQALAHLERREAVPVEVAVKRLTKEQYELLENFGLHSIENASIDVETLRRAVHAAVLVIPFKNVVGMEDMVAISHNSTKADLAAIRALLDIRCWCKTITSLEYGGVCVPCAALTAWVAAQDKQGARDKECS